jgi:hypothetical protein
MQESKVRGAAPGFGEVRAALQSREGIAETCRWRGRVALLQQLFPHAQQAAKRYDGTPSATQSATHSGSQNFRFSVFQNRTFAEQIGDPSTHPTPRCPGASTPQFLRRFVDPASDLSRRGPCRAPEGGRHRRTSTAPRRPHLGPRRGRSHRPSHWPLRRACTAPTTPAPESPQYPTATIFAVTGIDPLQIVACVLPC